MIPTRRAFRLVGPAIVMIATIAALGAAMSHFILKLRDNKQFMHAPPNFSAENNSEKDVFDTVSRVRDFFTVQAAGGALQIIAPGCEQRLNPQVRKDQDDALKILCDTAPGNQLLEEIEAANNSAQTLAIRDDRHDPDDPEALSGQTVACDDTTTPGLVVERGCFDTLKSATWKAYRLDGREQTAAAVSNREPRPESYRFLAGRVLWPLDWLSIVERASPSDAPQQFLLSTLVAAPDVPGLTVQYVGEPTAISIDGETFEFETPFPLGQTRRGPGGRETAALGRRAPSELVTRIGRVDVTIIELCRQRTADPALARYDERVRRPRCARDQARGYEIRLATDSPRDIRLSIRGGYQSSPPRVRDGRIPLSNHLGIACSDGSLPPACGGKQGADALKVVWIPPREKIKVNSEAEYDITDRNGESYFSENEFKPIVAASGLTPVIGVADDDGSTLNTYVSRLAAGKPPGSPKTVLRTSFDLRYQQIANAVLIDSVRARDRRKGAPYDGADEARTESRAAVVLMDADRNPGEILAMASTPSLRQGFHIWDVSALLDAPAADNPFAGQAWRAGDSRTMPGSTFKVVTALAAIRKAVVERDASIDAALRGMPAQDVARQFNVTTDTTKDWQGHSTIRVPTGAGDPLCPERMRACRNIHNPSGERTFEYGLTDSLMAACGSAGRRQIMGLCAALAQSSNLYFVGLSLANDSTRLTNGSPGYQERRSAEPLLLEAAGGRLFSVDPKKPVNLFDGYEGLPDCTTRRHRFCADAIDLYRPEIQRGLRLRYAQAGFGQGFPATPVGVATIYASLAANSTLSPTIVMRDRPKSSAPLIDAPAADQPRAQNYLQILRAGLGAVGRGLGTINGGGRIQMPHLKSRFTEDGEPRLFMKTGTAQISSHNGFGRRGGIRRGGAEYTGWLAGWLEPSKKAAPNAVTSRLAFTCMVTGGGNNEYGSGLCGPIIDRILCRIESAPGAEGACAEPERARKKSRKVARR
ncbi:MAG: penicillin-binding transpeptidase domain-containing protein [Rhodoblastus sp.]